MKLNIIPVKWSDEGVLMLDQRLLPTEETWLTLKTYDEVAAGIKDMVVRGAPAIGVSAAYGIALGAKNFVGTNIDDLMAGLLKPIFFGIIIGLISCYKGLSTKGGTVGVGISTTQAVVASSINVIIADFFLSKVLQTVMNTTLF